MIYVILGQTASGKTALATKIARKYQLPFIGGDAFQLYRELGIGVAKPTKEELQDIRSYFVSDVSITEEMNVKIYQERVRKIIEQHLNEGQDLIMSGGSFLYVRAALYPYEFPEADLQEYDFTGYTNEELYRQLEIRDPSSALKTHPNNRRRVEQALRLVAIGTPKSTIAMKDIKPLYPITLYSIALAKDKGDELIDKRVDTMIKTGLIAEVRSLIESGLTDSKAFQAIGYKEVIKGLREGWTDEQISAEIKKNTRHYAKRQRTFIRHQFPGLIEATPEEIERAVDFDQAFKSRTRLALGPVKSLKVEKTTALIAGVGGVGGSLLESLVRLGVRELKIIDNDTVEATNLNRQTLYKVDDIGKYKVECAKKHAENINPAVHIKTCTDRIKTSSLLNSERVDVIFDCIDDIEGKVELARLAKNQGALLIVATGSGLRQDSTKVVGGKLSEVGEPLAKAYKRRLTELGIDFTDFLCVYSKEVRAKRATSTLGSTHLVPNAFGLAMASIFLKTLD